MIELIRAVGSADYWYINSEILPATITTTYIVVQNFNNVYA